MRLVVGLGNPGRNYQLTRHNIGFLFLDYIAQHNKILFLPGKGDYYFSTLRWEEQEVLFVKPTTYMNLSGIACRQVVQHYQIPVQHMLVVYDDFQLPFGTLRFRARGSDGGHNGMASVIAQLAREDIPRLRLGIGAPLGDTVDFVLSPFSEQELEHLPQIFEVAWEGVRCWLKCGIEKTMSQFNRRLTFSNGDT